MAYKDKQTEKNKRFQQSLRHALSGCRQVIHEERNMRYHLGAIVLVIALGVFLNITKSEALWLTLATSLVLVSEIFNTTIENIVDLIVGHTYHPLAKKIKDMAAAAVLVSALFALIVGLLIFGPRIWHIIH